MDDLGRAPFGRTGFDVAGLCIGTSSWGPPRRGETADQRDERIARVADAFFSSSLPTNFIDTSNMYGDSLSELLIGRSLRAAGGLPDGLILQTKLDRRLDDDDFSAAQMWRSLEQSLERLGVGRVQVLYLHDPEVIGFDAAMAPGGPVEALREMKEQGVASAIGISGGPVRMLQDFVETDIFDALVTHNRFTLVDRSAESLLDAAVARRVGVTNAAPYGGGILTGSDRFRGTYGYRPIRAEVQKAVDAVSRLCSEAGVSLSAAALQFSMRDPRIDSTIVGVSDLERLEATIEEIGQDIPEDLWQAIDAVVPPASAALDA
jgi:D-threo-aldose 1-dehydrogenase